MTQANALTPTHGALALLECGALDQNPGAVYLAGLRSPRSRRTMAGVLNQIAREFGIEKIEKIENEKRKEITYLFVKWGAVRFQHTALVMSKLAERFKADYANLALCALRGALRAAFRLGQMSVEDYARACDVKRIGGNTLPRGRALKPGEIGALFDACANDTTPAGARDAAMLALLRLGLRRAEIAGIELQDFNQDTGALVVHGKGNKERTAYLENGARAALDDWLLIRGKSQGALLCPVSKAGEIERRALTPQVIYNALAKRAEQAGVQDVSPHDWRRTFAGNLLDEGVDISTVAQLMGHASVTTTARYDLRDEVVKKKATGLLHIPYKARAVVGVQNAR